MHLLVLFSNCPTCHSPPFNSVFLSYNTLILGVMDHNDSDTPHKNRHGHLPPDLDLTAFLNAEPKPTFILEVSHCEPLPFEILFNNTALLKDIDLRTHISGLSRDALVFRAWSQATTHWRQPYDFAGRSWTAFLIGGKWKAVRALVSIPITVIPENAVEELEEAFKRPDIGAARLDSMLRMMDLSEVGAFEVDTHGSMIWNNVIRPLIHPRQSNTIRCKCSKLQNLDYTTHRYRVV
jgi:hypothetical protein